MQDPQYLHVTLHFVDGDERSGNEHELAGAFDATRTSTVRKGIERRDTLDDSLRNLSCRSRTALGDVVADSLQIIVQWTRISRDSAG